ncbi:MAG: DegT/DnrJ/EryC1/StrS family aminotransferase [Gemmatimonadaceae bacterium]
MPARPRLYLSPPHLTGNERSFVDEAFASNWIAPLGPQVDAFEREFAAMVGSPHAVALSSGTAALHLALLECGVESGDEVVTSTFTFAATAFPIRYLRAIPVFVDSEPGSWNLDPALLAEWLERRSRHGRLPKAVVPVHLYGQSCDMGSIRDVCNRWEIPVIEDAAEALGATYHDRAPGTFGQAGVFSFNGNKIITTSGGGMLVTSDGKLAGRIRKLATQAREPAPHYEHAEIGYNYRLSNISAAIGRAQLIDLSARVAARRRNFEHYVQLLGDLPGITFQPEAAWGRHTRWLTCLLIDPALFGIDREAVRLALETENIEARPVWKPMHQQPVFQGCEVIGGLVADRCFELGLCLPSGSQLTPIDRERVASVIRRAHAERVGR